MRWTVGGAAQPDGQSNVTFTLTADTTAVAVYQVRQWTLSVQSTPVQGASIGGTPSGTTNYTAQVADNSTVSLTAPGAFSSGGADYTFVRWTVGGAAQPDGQAGVSFAINADTTAEATYAIQQWTVTVQSTPVTGVSISGTVSGTTQYSFAVADGSLASLTAPSSFSSGGTDYDFARWQINGSDQPDGQTTVSGNVNQDVTVVAVYESAQQWTLDVEATKTGISITGNPSGTTNYSAALDDGASVTLTAPKYYDPPGFGKYKFRRWWINGSRQPRNQKTITFTIGEDTTASAEYRWTW